MEQRQAIAHIDIPFSDLERQLFIIELNKRARSFRKRTAQQHNKYYSTFLAVYEAHETQSLCIYRL